jgi:hypothetical protein
MLKERQRAQKESESKAQKERESKEVVDEDDQDDVKENFNDEEVNRMHRSFLRGIVSFAF